MKTQQSSKSIKSLFRKGKKRIDRMMKQAKGNEIKAKEKAETESKNKRMINELMRKWENQMFHLKLCNGYYDLYTLGNLKVTEYGIKGEVALPDGKNFKDLEKEIETLEQNLECRIAFNRKGRRIREDIEFVKKLPTEIPFALIKVKPWEICTGLDYTGKPIIEDMSKTPHMFNCGITGGGKSFCIDHILINLIAHNKPDELELYLMQAAKGDMILYKDVKHCRAYGDSFRQIYIMCEHLKKICDYRKKIIDPYRAMAQANSYRDYNKVNKDEQLSTIYVVIDEIAALYDLKGIPKSEKEMKQFAIGTVRYIAQMGRAYGIFLILSIQRPTADIFDSFVKGMAGVQISFKNSNKKSSEVAMDDSNITLGLQQREFVTKDQKGQYTFGIIPLMDTKELHDKYLLPHKEKCHRDLFMDLQKLAKNSGNNVDIGNKPPTTTREQVNKENENLLVKENTSKIDGYVPWDGNVPTQTKKPTKQERRGREKV